MNNLKLHHQALIAFRQAYYSDLLYPNHVNTSDRVVKYREFYEVEDGKKVYYTGSDGKDKLKIYSMECDIYCLPHDGINELYALSKEQIDKLPIKVKDVKDMFLRREDKACKVVTEFASFRIRPIKEMELKELVSKFITPHSNPTDYELYAVLCVSLLFGRGAVWVSSNPAFGKSGLLKTFNMLFDGVPVVERVRTVPAIYKHIPEDGIMVIDEMAKKDAEASDNLLYALNIMGDVNESRIVMNTGGSAAFGTNIPKSLRNTSILCLMNRLGDYESPERFAEYMFSNNAALDRRFLKLRPDDGTLDMKYFSDWTPYTEDEKEYLRKMARTVAYYKPHLTENGWISGYKQEAEQKWVANAIKYGESYFKATHIATVRLFLEVLSIYCKDDYVKFSEMSQRFFQWIDNYKRMLKQQDAPEFKMNEIVVKDEPKKTTPKYGGEVVRMQTENKSLNDVIDKPESDLADIEDVEDELL